MATINGNSTSAVDKGYTLVEMAVVTAIMSVVALSTISLFRLGAGAFVAGEARSSLSSGSQNVLNHIGQELTQNKRLFQNTPADLNFLNIERLSGTPAASLSSSRLPTIVPNGSISPGVPSAVGNELFFAKADPSQDLTVLDSASVTSTVRIDTDRFKYYFLAQDLIPNHTIGNKAQINFWEWESVSYADYDQIVRMSGGDSTKRSHIVAALVNKGVSYAWSSSAVVNTPASPAFYKLQPSLTADPGHQIRQSSSSTMKFLKVSALGGYRYGVSPNTGSGFTTSKPVPQLTNAGGNFPSGFEIAMAGPTGGRQVFIRLVLVAEGSFKGILALEEVVLSDVQDAW
jgi:prepilin-type N-terminal cleavage/methylation domain-containing protein